MLLVFAVCGIAEAWYEDEAPDSSAFRQ